GDVAAVRDLLVGGKDPVQGTAHQQAVELGFDLGPDRGETGVDEECGLLADQQELVVGAVNRLPVEDRLRAGAQPVDALGDAARQRRSSIVHQLSAPGLASEMIAWTSS